MSTVIDNAPKFFEDTQDNDELGNDDNFPDAVILISLGGGKFAGVNITTTGPDPMQVGAIACFATDAEADLWSEQWDLTGEHVSKEFQEARDIAVSKPAISALALQVGGNTRHIHWVR